MFLALLRRGPAPNFKNGRYEVKELNETEIDNVGGGFIQFLAAAITIYKAADIAYEFYKGLKDGAAGA